MDLLANLALGLSTALEPQNLLYCFIGTLLGTLIGVLPGIGPTATIAMLLPITYTVQPVSSIIMLAGIFYGAQYGGSTTAILINLPGEASSAVTSIDGYQMARQGRAGPALAAAALGSFFAGTVATLLVAVAAVPLTKVALSFGSAEYCALMILGLISSVALAHGSILKALAMTVLGLLLGLAGTDVFTGAKRFTLGFRELDDGLNFVSLAVGVFGLAEILRNLENARGGGAVVSRVHNLFPSWEELKAMAAPILRGTALGSALGVLPGGGPTLASFAAYSMEKKLSSEPERFGKGAIEGVAGPESANNAAAQTSFIPMLTLGIPSNPVMAMIAGALIIHGVVPGPNVVTERPALFWGVIASMWIGNLMLLILNLPLIGLWVRLLRIPYYAMFPAIIAFSSIGVYSVNANPFDLYAVSAFGLLGYALVRLGCEPAPMLLGFVLGPMLEEHFRRAMIIARGDPAVFLERPISAGLLALAALVLVAAFVPSVARKREEVFVEAD